MKAMERNQRQRDFRAERLSELRRDVAAMIDTAGPDWGALDRWLLFYSVRKSVSLAILCGIRADIRRERRRKPWTH